MKQEIKAAALNLFLKYGPKRTTIDDIIWELQISKKAFYEYFTNKDELVKNLFKGVVQDAKSSLFELADNEKDDLTLFLKWQYRFYAYLKGYSISCSYELSKYYHEVVEDYNMFRKNVVFKGLMRFAKQARKMGWIREDVNISLFVKMQIYSLEELLFGRFSLNNNPTEQEQNSYADHIIINNVRGVIEKNYIKNFDGLAEKVKSDERKY